MHHNAPVPCHHGRHEPGPTFSLESREWIDASAMMALVRVHGRWTARPAIELAAPQLEILLDGASRRFSSLPDLAAKPLVATPEGADWRAAYPVPAELADQVRSMVLRVAGAEPAVLFKAADLVEQAIAERDEALHAGRDAIAGQVAARETADAAHANAASERERRHALGAETEATPADADGHASAEQAEGDAGGELERLRPVERDRAELQEVDASRASADGSAPPGLERRISELETELEVSRHHGDELADRLLAAQHQVDEAVAHMRMEAEARHQAEARAAAHQQADEDALGVRAAQLEFEGRTARAEADRLTSELLDARRALDEASLRLQEETEARMWAEARAGERPGE